MRTGFIALAIATTMTPMVQGQFLCSTFPERSLTAQYAGSIGTGSLAYTLYGRSAKWGVGLSYGRTPESAGGPLNTYALRVIFTPWDLELGSRLSLQPVRTGLFVAYTAGFDLRATWPSYLEPGYYWWTPNFRQHLYLRSQLSYRTGPRFAERIGVYFEANTNDLYVYSWWRNRRSITPYDIIFFGIGVELRLNACASEKRPSE